MKIVITASSPDLDATVDLRFGRAFCFIVIDEDGLEWEAFPNPALDARGGAGVQATRFIAEKEAGVVISGSFGPNAFETLTAADIQMLVIPADKSFTVREVLSLYQAGQLAGLSSPGNPGHRDR